MGYYIHLEDPITGDTLQAEAAHHIRGGTYAVGGTTELSMSVTYNYAKFYYEHLDREKGIRVLYGMTGAESIPVLSAAIEALGDDVHDYYWIPTEGNAKRALIGLRAFAQMRPDGIWSGD